MSIFRTTDCRLFHTDGFVEFYGMYGDARIPNSVFNDIAQAIEDEKHWHICPECYKENGNMAIPGNGAWPCWLVCDDLELDKQKFENQQIDKSCRKHGGAE